MISFPSNSVYTLYRPVESSKEKKKVLKKDLSGFYNVRYSILLHLPPHRFHCVGGMLGSNPGQLRLRHWL
jgi:hypothetical protein